MNSCSCDAHVVISCHLNQLFLFRALSLYFLHDLRQAVNLFLSTVINM
jgi:hypothetical protein